VAQGFNPVTLLGVQVGQAAELNYGFKLERSAGNTLPGSGSIATAQNGVSEPRNPRVLFIRIVMATRRLRKPTP
jgi:hypothetical protein